MNCTRLGKFCIASVFMLCSSSASALDGDDESALADIALGVEAIQEYLFRQNLMVAGISNSLPRIEADLTLNNTWWEQFLVNDIASSSGSHNWQRYLAAQSYLLGGVDGLSSSERTKANLALASLGLTYQKALTNSLPYYLREILKATKGSQDILAANPWWATNSEFAWNWDAWDDAPKPTGKVASFPEAFSLLMSMQIVPEQARTANNYPFYGSLSQAKRGWSDMFGVGSRNYHEYTYSVYDYLADWMKSNNAVDLSMRYSASTGALLAELESQGYDSTVNSPTNPPLPEYVDPFEEVSYIGSRVAQKGVPGRTLINSRVTALSGMLDGSTDPTITVIPEFTVGGIHVQQYTASLDTPITSAVHSVMFFLFYVSLFAGLFDLAQTEFGFYANLGRTWTVSRGIPHN